MTQRRTGRVRRIVLRVLAAVGILLVLLVAVSALSNLVLPGKSAVVDRLPDAEKARVAEALHLKQTLGDSLWMGWGKADIPVIIHNESYAFLIGYPNPPSGWVKVPQNLARGGPWEAVPGDTFDGQTYYRQHFTDPKVSPEAFTVKVGDRWVASLTTREWMQIGVGNQVGEDLPPLLSAIFPYRFFGRVVSGSTDQYITLVLHESFHAYEGMQAPARFKAGEEATRFEGSYPSDDKAFQDNWQKELDLLADAVRATSDTQARDLAARFVAQRQDRRSASGLSASGVEFERQREWLEGLAKYTEMTIWRQAYSTPGYAPLPAATTDSDFNRYKTFEDRWSQEVDQARRMSGADSDTRLYYSGMLQATLLDRLMPGWKSKIMQEGIWLEDLLQQAAEQE